MTPAGIPQRRLNGRLHEVHRGVYAVGRRELSRDGELMAAVLACGPRVDFFWPDLGFVVEADSLRHHRTAAEQTVDLSRDQAHARRGLRTLRFTHSQVFHRPAHVKVVLIDAFGHR
jgi:hypothetical protein